jgi:hypothetical protein
VQRFSGKERKSNEKYILEGFDRDNANDHIASDKMSNLNYQG